MPPLGLLACRCTKFGEGTAKVPHNYLVIRGGIRPWICRWCLGVFVPEWWRPEHG